MIGCQRGRFRPSMTSLGFLQGSLPSFCWLWHVLAGPGSHGSHTCQPGLARLQQVASAWTVACQPDFAGRADRRAGLTLHVCGCVQASISSCVSDGTLRWSAQAPQPLPPPQNQPPGAAWAPGNSRVASFQDLTNSQVATPTNRTCALCKWCAVHTEHWRMPLTQHTTACNILLAMLAALAHE